MRYKTWHREAEPNRVRDTQRHRETQKLKDFLLFTMGLIGFVTMNGNEEEVVVTFYSDTRQH
jgi:hypothetical protein